MIYLIIIIIIYILIQFKVFKIFPRNFYEKFKVYFYWSTNHHNALQLVQFNNTANCHWSLTQCFNKVVASQQHIRSVNLGVNIEFCQG